MDLAGNLRVKLALNSNQAFTLAPFQGRNLPNLTIDLNVISPIPNNLDARALI